MSFTARAGSSARATPARSCAATGVDGAHDGIVTRNTLAGFCHLRNTSADPGSPVLLSFVRQNKTGG
ncbi:MAG: hypothetical protein R3D59_03500 [Paracoccaceae bacterium]